MRDVQEKTCLQKGTLLVNLMILFYFLTFELEFFYVVKIHVIIRFYIRSFIFYFQTKYGAGKTLI